MYSRWIKADLHIHTNFSSQTKINDYRPIFSVEMLANKLREHSVGLISLTDHNIINCTAYSQMIPLFLNTLVGVELDIALAPEKLCEYIEAVKKNNGDRIEGKPFHVVVIFRSNNYTGLSQKLESMYSLIGKSLLCDENYFHQNKFHRITTLKQFAESFIDEDYFIIAHGDKDKGIIPPYKKANNLQEAQYEILLGGITALEMRSNVKFTNTIESYNHGFAKLIKDNFITSKTTSYVVFSDNHDCSNYAPRDFQTWIKGDATFETLRLAFSDPESRIHTSLYEPTYTTSYIETVQVNQENQGPQQIALSPHLNVIIGGRSSGKSLLFNLLIALNSSLIKDKGVFDSSYARFIRLDDQRIKVFREEIKPKISLNGEAYTQEKIIKMFENNAELRAALSEEFLNVTSETITRNETIIDTAVDNLLEAYREYYEVSNVFEKGDLLKHIRLSIKKSDRAFILNTAELIPSYDRDTLVSMRTELSDLVTKVTNVLNMRIGPNLLFSENERQNISITHGIISSKIMFLSSAEKKVVLQKQFFDAVRLVDDKYNKRELSQEKQEIEMAKAYLTDTLSDYRKYFTAKIRLRHACEALSAVSIHIDDLVNHAGKYSFITKINLNITGAQIISDFFAEKIMNYSTALKLYNNLLNLASLSQSECRLKQNTVSGKHPESLSTKLKEFTRQIKSKVTYEIHESDGNGGYTSTSATSQGKKASIFLDIKLNSYISKAYTGILMIDQPEDNIDNNYISEELVTLIRQLKKNMQIILVTHNPSIAVYGDAENIIIAENTSGTFTYSWGGLENASILKSACKILDGGEVAFQNRMNKYHIDKLVELVEGEGNEH